MWTSPSRAAMPTIVDDEEETVTLARFVPVDSEVRALLDDPETTLAYIREVRASIPDPDSALDSLVAVYEERVARLEKDRAHAAAIVAQANVRRAAAAQPAPARSSEGPLARMQPHFWKIVYSTICVWGLLQLALTR